MATTRIRKSSLSGCSKFVMVNREGVDTYIIDTMIELIKLDRFVHAIRLARGNAPALSLKEAKDLAEAIRDQINGRVPNYVIENDLNFLTL